MIRRLLKSLREFRLPTILTMLVMLGEVVMETLIPYKMADLIDIGFYDGDMPFILKTGLLLLLFSFISLLFGSMGSFFGAKAGTGFAKNLRFDMYKNIQKFSFANIDRFSTSSIITRLTTDVSNVQNTFTMATRMAVRTPMTLLISIVMLFFIQWKLALIILAVVPILIVGFAVLAKKVFPIFTRLFKRYDELNNSVQENLRGIRVVKSFVRRDEETDKFTEASGNIFNDSVAAERLMAWLSPYMQFWIYVGMLVLSFIGAFMVVGKEPVTVSLWGTVFTTGLLNSTFTYAMQILFSCMGMSMILVMIVMSRESMRRIDEVLCEKPTITNPEDAVTTVIDGSVDFTDVQFSYSNDLAARALLDVNLHIPSGTTVGIIGGTGTSKTTLIQLIPRLYDVTAGSVKVGGIDVRDYDLFALRDAVSVVLQKNVLFAGTIRENLRWGNANATDDELVAACKAAAAHDFIMEFPDGYDTVLDQGGTNVSGGQKQRLCIARALLKKPKILILDDSTSAVDTATDAYIRHSFRECIPNTTKFIIAQRITSVMDADMILVMDDGRVTAVGTHDELMKISDIYREVYESQQKGGDGDGNE